jgi:hypothetical protein
MKMFAVLAGLVLAAPAGAALSARAALTGQHVSGSFAGAPLLICEYSTPHAKFEIVSQDGACAPYLTVQ